MTQAVTLFALLELYKSGELVWRQRETFGEIEIMTADRHMSPLARQLGRAALLLARPGRRRRPRRGARGSRCRTSTRRSPSCATASARRELGIVLREVAGGYTFASDPEADVAVRRLLSKPRTPPLSQAQAECLAIVAYLQPVSRPEIARIRGVNSDSPVSTLEERGLIEEKGRSQFGAILYQTTPLFEKLFGLEDLDGAARLQGVRAERRGRRRSCATSSSRPASSARADFGTLRHLC